MERSEFLNDIALRIKDIDLRRNELKEWIDKQPAGQQRNEAEKLLQEMDRIRDSLDMQYIEIAESTEREMPKDNVKFRQMEENIYTNIRSFDNAFKNAGAFFRGPRRT